MSACFFMIYRIPKTQTIHQIINPQQFIPLKLLTNKSRDSHDIPEWCNVGCLIFLSINDNSHMIEKKSAIQSKDHDCSICFTT